MFNKKATKIIIITMVLAAGIGGLLYYYQSQGILRIFPTGEDSKISKLLAIDESKFVPANGLSEEKFKEKIQELYKQKEIVKKNTKDPNEWFTFGKIKEFLNDHNGAAMAWEKSYDLQPYDFRTIFSLASVTQYFLKDYDEAEGYYLKVLELQPEFTSAYQGLMDIYRYNQKEKNDKFEPLVLRAISLASLDEDKAKYYYYLADFFSSESTKNVAKAKEYFQEVKKRDQKKAGELSGSYPFLID